MNNPFSDYTIYHNLNIKAPVERVFEAISQPEHLENWWPLTCTGQPELGSVYNFYFEPAYNWYGQLIEYIPNKSFHIKMTESDEDWNPTSFGFDLSDKGDAVKLQFRHTGWKECNEHFKIASFCWAILLNGLKQYVEKGIVLPFEERS